MDQEHSDIPQEVEKAAKAQANAPLGIRLAAIIVVLGIIGCLFSGSCGGEKEQDYTRSIEDSFPQGAGSLSDVDPKEEQARAFAEEMKQRQARAKSENKLSDKLSLLKKDVSKTTALRNSTTKAKPRPSSKNASLSQGPFTIASSSTTRPFDVIETKSGDVYVAGQQGIDRFVGASSAAIKEVLSANIFDREFNDTLPPITSIAPVGEDEVWLGFTNGLLMRYQRYEWKILSKPFQAIKARIAAIVGFGNEVFLAGNGLYKWDSDYSRLLADPNFRNKRLDSFGISKSGKLYLGGRDGLWEYNSKTRTWSLLWKVTRNDRSIYTIHPDHENSILLGTRNGIVRLSYRGAVTERLLPKEHIRAITSDEKGGLWIGTVNRGLKYWNGSAWFAVGAAEGLGNLVSTVHVDRKGTLWCGVDKKGVFAAPVKKARAWISKFSDKSIPKAKPAKFGDACEAAEVMLKGASISGDVAVDTVDGRQYVFFRGQQVCPKGMGYRRVDGTVLLLNGWNLTRYLDQKRSEFKIDEQIPADKASALLYDSRDRLWLGTSGAGLFLLSNGQWSGFGQKENLFDNPITTVVEDGNENIWVGTTPPFDEENKTYTLPNLHLYNDQGWYHFSPRNGLAHHLTESILPLRSGSMAIGTNGGLSLIDKKGVVVNYSEEQGIKPHYVYSVSADHKGRIWMAHQFFGDGITVLNGKVSHRLDKSNGLFYNRIEKVAHDRSRRVWILGSNGGTAVYPISYLEKKFKPRSVKTKRIKAKNMFEGK